MTKSTAPLSHWWISTEKRKLPQRKEGKKMARRANNNQSAKSVRQKAATKNGAIMPPHPFNHDSQGNSTALWPRVTPINNNRAPIHSGRLPAIGNPKTELEAATQRFVDLYDFAPIAYISFDRAGRIEEANLAATKLLGVARDLLIGRPFAFYVADLDSFLRHLLYCRTTHEQVATGLELKPRKGQRIPV